MSATSIEAGGQVITPMITAGALVIVLLTQLINHTKIGMAMRAVSKDFETGAADGHQDQLASSP